MADAGGKFKVGLPGVAQVVSAGKLMTGQNAASAAPLATAIVYAFDAIQAEFEPPRLALLKSREALAATIAEADDTFKSQLASLKKSETSGVDVAAKLEELTCKAAAGATYYSSALADLDVQLARNAALRQAALDAKAAAEAAAEEE